MHRQSDSSTYELSRARLKLADDLIFTPQQYDDRVFYHIEQPSRQRFFKIGWTEYVLISLFDGETSLAEALSRTAGALGQEAFAEAEATSICAWLIENGLAATVERGHRDSSLQNAKGQSFSHWLNPFWMKFPLCRPDRLLDVLAPWLGWLHSKPMLLLSVVFWMTAAGGIVFQWEAFALSSRGVLAPSNWLWLGAAWLGLKVLHEFSHALVCKRYGGPVPEMGVILVLFAPMAYVDVTSSWGFRSRWQRMHVAAAGMIAEFHVAAVCAIIWLRTDSPHIAHVLFTVIFMASLTTLLFNANPLMRFDGYYLLSDLFNIPNLSSNGSQYLKGVLSRWFLGEPARQIGWRGVKGLFVRAYGVLAFLWRIVVCVGLMIAASMIFHGAGLVIAGFAGLTWLCLPLLRAVLVWGQTARRKPGLVIRLMFSTALIGGLAHLVWDVVPWPGARQANGIIEYAPLSVVRAEIAGFVEEVLVKDGQTVHEGDVLARLRNEDLEIECRDLELGIKQSEIKRRKHRDEGEIALAQVEEKNCEALEKRLSELEARRQSLLIRAPISGRVMARKLPLLANTYLKEGEPLLEIGVPLQKELQIAVSQPDIDTYRGRLNEPVSIRLRTGTVWLGKLVKLDPRATQTAPHPALCSPHGGPLPVKAATDSQKEPEEHQLVEPHLQGRVMLSPETSSRLEAGQLGCVVIFDEEDTLGRVAYRRAIHWLRDRKDLFQDQAQK